jgi:hypothetical protein
MFIASRKDTVQELLRLRDARRRAEDSEQQQITEEGKYIS